MNFMFTSKSPSLTNQMIVKAIEWNRDGNRMSRWVTSRGIASLGVGSASLRDAIQEAVLSAYDALKALYLCCPSNRSTQFRWLRLPSFSPKTSESKQSLGKAWRHFGNTFIHIAIAVTALTLGTIAPSELFLPAIKKIGFADHLQLQGDLLSRITAAARVHGPKIVIGLATVAVAAMGYRSYVAAAAAKPENVEKLFKVYILMTIAIATMSFSLYQRYSQHLRENAVLLTPRPEPEYPTLLFIERTQPFIQASASQRALSSTEEPLQRCLKVLNSTTCATAFQLNTALDDLGSSKASFALMYKRPDYNTNRLLPQIVEAEKRLNESIAKVLVQLNSEPAISAEKAIRAKLKKGRPLHTPQTFTCMRAKSDVLCILEILCKRIAVIRSTTSCEVQREQIQAVESLWLMASDYQKQLLEAPPNRHLFDNYRCRYLAQISQYCPSNEQMELVHEQIIDRCKYPSNNSIYRLDELLHVLEGSPFLKERVTVAQLKIKEAMIGNKLMHCALPDDLATADIDAIVGPLGQQMRLLLWGEPMDRQGDMVKGQEMWQAVQDSGRLEQLQTVYPEIAALYNRYASKNRE